MEFTEEQKRKIDLFNFYFEELDEEGKRGVFNYLIGFIGADNWDSLKERMEFEMDLQKKYRDK